ncbi:hypothetical protein [Bacillus toyonensis]|uniref:hypothetical protein n=1 Tax=Bacillus toyonensis TaxID=155322 RepID=UPI001C0394AD|nr:hypothetical protein [Bacillus toyonensis]UFI00467.1 hypothetical protein HQN46_0004190 [Bacillus toyonensis]
MQKWKLIYQVIIFLLLVSIGVFKYATPIGNWASLTACIGIFIILQSLTRKHNKIARRFIGELFYYASFVSSFVFSVAK